MPQSMLRSIARSRRLSDFLGHTPDTVFNALQCCILLFRGRRLGGIEAVKISELETDGHIARRMSKTNRCDFDAGMCAVKPNTEAQSTDGHQRADVFLSVPESINDADTNGLCDLGTVVKYPLIRHNPSLILGVDPLLRGLSQRFDVIKESLSVADCLGFVDTGHSAAVDSGRPFLPLAFQLSDLFVEVEQVHITAVAGGNGLVLRGGVFRTGFQGFHGAHRPVSLQKLGDEPGFSVEHLPADSISGAFRHVVEDLHFVVLVALPQDTSFALFQVGGLPRHVEVVESNRAVLNVGSGT